jgi:hypothetical protein
MRLHVLGSLVALAALVATPARADVRVTLSGGVVTVSAKDASVRQILTEWARVGQTRIVNVERLADIPLTIELSNVPESEALDTLLRTVSGYLAAPRASVAPNVSRYDRIFILPTSTGTAPRPVPAANPGPTFAPPAPNPPPPDEPDDDAPPQRGGAPVAPNGPARVPAFNTFPQPAAGQREEQPPQQAQPQAYPTPTAPVGVSTPGMVVPAPQQPGQQPGQPQGRGGGSVR